MNIDIEKINENIGSKNMSNELGLKKTDLSYIIATIKQFEEITKAAIFGSRAKGNYKQGSDVDVALWGAEKISFTTLARLHDYLEEESPMPYFFDIIDYQALNNEDLKEHIDRVGVVIFERNL